MISLEEQFEVDGLRRALLATYAVSVPHVERAVVGRLLESATGHAEILLLADGQQHERDLVDTGFGGISGPGVDYRLHPIYLESRYQAFHPKLYVLEHAEGVRVVIGSANLTAFGCRKNAELIECFDLQPEGPGASVAEDVAGIIEALRTLDSPLPNSVLGQLSEMAGRLDALSERLAPAGARVLHSTNSPLWDQVAAHIERSVVRRTAIVTPYFDRAGKAVRSVVDAWPDADHLVITQPDGAGALDGSAVSSWPVPPTLRLYQSFQGEARRLHAKALLVETDDATWVVSGSANLTDPAWLRSVRDGGNFEVVVLRRLEAGVIEGLLEPLRLEEGRWTDLAYEPDEEGEPDTTRTIHLGGAELGPDGLTLTARPGEWTEGHLTVRLSLRGMGPWPATIRARTDKHVVVRCSVDGAALGDRPAVVELRAELEDVTWSGRTWVTREDLLGRPSPVKRISNLAASLSGSGNLGIRDFLLLLKINRQVLKEVRNGGRRGDRKDAGDDAESAPEPDTTMPAAHLIERKGSPMARVPPARFSSSRERWSLLQALRSLNKRTRGRSRAPGPDVAWGSDELADDHEDVAREPTPDEREILSETASRARELIEREITEDLRPPPLQDEPEFVAERWEAMVYSGVSIDLEKSAEDFEDEIAPLREGLRDGIHALFSLTVDGRTADEAHPEGWLVWAWGREETRTFFEDLGGAGRRYGKWLATVLALLVRLRQTVPEAMPGSEQSGLSNLEIDVLTGLRLTLGEGRNLRPETGTPADEAYRATLRDLVALSNGLVSEGDAEQLAKQFEDSNQQPAVVEATKNVLPLLWHLDGDVRAEPEGLEGVHPSLQGIAADIRRGRDPRIGEVIVVDQGTYCASCAMRLPSADEQHLRSLSPPYAVECPDQLHRLVPLAVRSPVVQRIVSEFWPGLTVDSESRNR